MIQIRLSQALLSSTVRTGTGEIHEQQCYRSGHDGRDRGDSEDLRVDILHDLCGLGPYICCRISRLAEHHGHRHTQKAHVSYFCHAKDGAEGWYPS